MADNRRSAGQVGDLSMNNTLNSLQSGAMEILYLQLIILIYFNQSGPLN